MNIIKALNRWKKLYNNIDENSSDEELNELDFLGEQILLNLIKNIENSIR